MTSRIITLSFTVEEFAALGELIAGAWEAATDAPDKPDGIALWDGIYQRFEEEGFEATQDGPEVDGVLVKVPG